MAYTFSHWVREAQSLSEQQFLELYSSPFLLILEEARLPVGAPELTIMREEDRDFLAASLTFNSERSGRFDALSFPVHPLQKSALPRDSESWDDWTARIAPGGRKDVLASMITLGRSNKNDLVLRAQSVSGVHAFFMERDGKWFLRDMRSRNGTYVGDRRVDDRPVVLADKTDIRFSRIGCRFVLPATMFEMLRLSLRSLRQDEDQ